VSEQEGEGVVDPEGLATVQLEVAHVFQVDAVVVGVGHRAGAIAPVSLGFDELALEETYVLPVRHQDLRGQRHQDVGSRPLSEPFGDCPRLAFKTWDLPFHRFEARQRRLSPRSSPRGLRGVLETELGPHPPWVESGLPVAQGVLVEQLQVLEHLDQPRTQQGRPGRDTRCRAVEGRDLFVQPGSIALFVLFRDQLVELAGAALGNLRIEVRGIEAVRQLCGLLHESR
jgi:hypothetical protein